MKLMVKVDEILMDNEIVFLGKIGIEPNQGDRAIARRLIDELSIPKGRAEWDDWECEILFESQEIDTIIEMLKAAQQNQKFQNWCLSYDLCRGDGLILQEGIISEEQSIVRYPNGNTAS